MSSRSFKSIYYHIVFRTKLNEPYLKDRELRNQVWHFIENKCKRHNFFLHKIGGIENHIHLLIYIPPKTSISEAVKLIKGSSSYFVNKELGGDDILYWQNGYGVLTLSPKNVPFIKQYIENQEEHHKNKTIYNGLEECEDENILEATKTIR